MESHELGKGCRRRAFWMLDMFYISTWLHRHMPILKFTELYILSIHAFCCVLVIPQYRAKTPKSMKTVINIPALIPR